MEYQIGEFSIITRLTVKTIRFYHEEGLLLPARVDGFTGYRYYNAESVNAAQLIKSLRDFDFSVPEIRQVLAECSEDEDLADLLQRKAATMREARQMLQAKERSLNAILDQIKEMKIMNTNQEISIKDYPAELVATIRFKGKYSEIGQYFGALFKAAGGKTSGKPFALYHDNEYREEAADIEAGLPVRAMIQAQGVSCNSLAAGQFLVATHRGSYASLSATYQRLFEKAQELGRQTTAPIREIYLKGPGMFFRGNPRNYITEIRLPLVAKSIPAQ